MRGVTGNNEELGLVSIFVAAGRIPPSSEMAVGHIHRLCTLVAIVLTILADNVRCLTGSSHVLEGVVQKGVLRLTVLSIIIDTTHCDVA